MHFQNSFTQNCDHHVLLIMTGNAHKDFCLKLLLILILVREKGLYILKLIVATKWWLLSQLKKNYSLVSLFSDVVLPLSYLYLWYLVPNLAALFVLFPA